MAAEFPTHTVLQALRSGPPLRLAVLFGSGARGTTRADSDVDIGILPIDAGLPLHEEIKLQHRLEAACGRPVDVVRLDRASTVLLGEVARDAKLLFEAHDGDFVGFRVRALHEWLEFAPAYRHAAERFRQRLIEIGSRSA